MQQTNSLPPTIENGVESIHAATVTDVQYAQEALKWQLEDKRKVSPHFRYILFVTTVVIIIAGFAQPTLAKAAPSFYFVLPILMMLLAFWTELLNLIFKQFVARSVLRSPFLGKRINWKFNCEEFEIITDGTEEHVAWQTVNEALYTPAGCLLYLDAHKRSSLWLPKSAFKSLEEYARLENLVATKTNHRNII